MKRILIVKLSALGDIIHLSWILPALKKTYPQVHIDWVVDHRYEKLLHHFKEIDRVIPVDFQITPDIFRFSQKLLALWKNLHHPYYDAVVDAQGLLRSALLTLICRSSKKIGFPFPVAREGSHFFYRVRPSATVDKINVVDKYLELFREIGVVGYEPSYPSLDLATVDSIRVDSFLQSFLNSKKIVINPSASFYTKLYPIEKILSLAEMIRRELGSPLIVLNDGLGTDFEKIASHPDIHLTPIFSLTELLVFFKQCDMLIGVDSGPSYMAEIVGTPTLILFGPTNLERQSPSKSRDPQLQSVFYREDKVKNLSVYSDYVCPIVRSGVIYFPYRCLNRFCSNNLCMKNFDSDFILRKVKNILT